MQAFFLPFLCFLPKFLDFTTKILYKKIFLDKYFEYVRVTLK